MTQNLIAYFVLALVPAAAFYGARLGLERLAGRSRRDPRPTPAVSLPSSSLDRLTHRLRRLGADYASIEASLLPGRAARLRAVSMAYDDTLRDCCVAAGLPDPGRPPLTAESRLLLEADLNRRGVTW